MNLQESQYRPTILSKYSTTSLATYTSLNPYSEAKDSKHTKVPFRWHFENIGGKNH